MESISLLADILRAAGYELSFTFLEVGARPTTGEPFYELLSVFPGSRIVAVEADEEVCAAQNAKNIATVIATRT